MPTLTAARRPVTLFTVAGLPATTDPGHVQHMHPRHSVVGYVVVQTLPGPRRDVAAFDGAQSYGSAFTEAMKLRTGAGWGTPAAYAVVDTVYACGARSMKADPAEEVEAVASECEAGDGYPDPSTDAEVECIGDTSGPVWHRECHAAVCTSRACAEHNDL